MKKINDRLKWMFLWAFFVAFAVMMFSHAAHAARLPSEASYQYPWCEKVGGKVDHVVSQRKEVDCLTQTHAIEFDFASKYYEAIGQSLTYAMLTGKRAGIALIIERRGDKKYLNQLRSVIAFYSLPIDVWEIGKVSLVSFPDEASALAEQ